MPRHTQPFDDITLDSHVRFERHLQRTYGRPSETPEPDSKWVDITPGVIDHRVTVISVHADARIPYAEIDDSHYGRGQLRLMAFGRWLKPQEDT
jgi:hypothetical protein